MNGDLAMTYRILQSADNLRVCWPLTRIAGPGLAVVGGAAVLGLALSATPATADEWFLEARGSVIGTYDDNVRLRDEDKEDALGVIVRPELDIHGRGENWDIVFTNFAAFERYDDSSFDSDNFGVELDSSYRTQLQVFGLDGLVSRETTLVTEQDDTGDFEDEGFKHTYEVGPFWSYQFTPRQSIGLGADVEIVDYTGTDAFDDFQTYGGDISWGYQLTEQDEITTSFIYSHTNNDDDENSESDFFGIALGWGQEVSDRLDWFFQAGPRYFESEEDQPGGGTDKDSSFGYFFNGELKYRATELLNLRARVERRVVGSGGGGSTETNRLRLNAHYRFQPRWVASLATAFTLNQDPSDDDDERDRNFFSVTPRIAYVVTPDWQVWSSYRFRTDNEKGADRAYSNAVFVGVTYSAPKWTFAN